MVSYLAMNNADKLFNLRHTAAHLLAKAVLELYPSTHNAIGPAIANGFYQDFDMGEVKLSDADLPKVEAKMRELVQTWEKFTFQEVTLEEAEKLFAWNPYKLELAREFASGGNKLQTNNPGNFLDLCKMGHVEHPNIELQHFKLLSVAGAYWRGDANKPMLTRIYGTCFPTAKELETYLQQLEEGKRRDHRKLGKELELFTIIDEIGPGLPLFYPKGAQLRRTVEEFFENEQRALGFVNIWVPHIAKSALYERSGHLGKYDAMFPPMRFSDDDDYYLKPMNCPHFMMLYKSQPHSYKELPLRWTCTTTVYRHEKSGELAGLTRVRSVTQDDCHIFLRPDQIEQELDNAIKLLTRVYAAFGLTDFWVSISTRDPATPEKYLGDSAVWDNAERILTEVIAKRSWQYKIVVGEAAFYGPKLDFIAKDAIGREWQLSTLQLDFNLPQRFELEYTDDSGQKQRPVVIHRAILGATERWLGVIIEHFAGNFPVWLAPVQVALLSVNDSLVPYCGQLGKELSTAGLRVEINGANETVGNKIRLSTQQKIPYLLVIGEKEKQSGQLAVRKRGSKETSLMSLADFVGMAQKQIINKSLTL